MYLQTRITRLRKAVISHLGRSFAALASRLAGLWQARRQAIEVAAGEVVPPALVAGNTDAAPAEPRPAAPREAVGHTEAAPVLADTEPTPCPIVPAAAVAPAVEDEVNPVPTSLDPVPKPVAVAAPESLPTDAPEIQVDTPAQPACPVVAVDAEMEKLRERFAWMETRILDLESRKAEMEQLLDEFAVAQYSALGDVVDEQLRLQQELLRHRAERSSSPEDQLAAEAAAAEYDAYRQAHAEAAAPPAELSDDERDELKSLYRAAAMRCHPDRVGETEKSGAHELFLRTQDAYRRRDLDAMRQIIRQLGATEPSAVPNEGGLPRERLEALLEKLGDKGVELLLAIQSIQMQPAYRRARQRELWADYFAAARARLEDECVELRRQLARY